MFRNALRPALAIASLLPFPISFAACSTEPSRQVCSTFAEVVMAETSAGFTVEFDGNSAKLPLSGKYFADGSSEIVFQLPGDEFPTNGFYEDPLTWVVPRDPTERVLAINGPVTLQHRARIPSQFLSSDCSPGPPQTGVNTARSFPMGKSGELRVSITDRPRPWTIEDLKPRVCVGPLPLKGFPVCGPTKVGA